MPEILSSPLARRHLASLATGLLGALLLPGSGAAAVPAAGLAAWFRLGEARTADWQIEPVDGDPLQAVVRRAHRVAGPLRRLLVLYPRPSPAYDIAISKALEVFAAKGLNVELLAFNFQRVDGRGAAALQMVEDGGFDLVLSMG